MGPRNPVQPVRNTSPLVVCFISWLNIFSNSTGRRHSSPQLITSFITDSITKPWNACEYKKKKVVHERILKNLFSGIQSFFQCGRESIDTKFLF